MLAPTMGWWALVYLAPVATLAAWIAAAGSGRLRWRVALRGVVVGVGVTAAVVFVWIVVLWPLLPKETLGGFPGAGAAAMLAAVYFAGPALTVLWYGVTLVPLGAFMGRDHRWATRDAWIAAVVAAAVTVGAFLVSVNW